MKVGLFDCGGRKTIRTSLSLYVAIFSPQQMLLCRIHEVSAAQTTRAQLPSSKTLTPPKQLRELAATVQLRHCATILVAHISKHSQLGSCCKLWCSLSALQIQLLQIHYGVDIVKITARYCSDRCGQTKILAAPSSTKP